MTFGVMTSPSAMTTDLMTVRHNGVLEDCVVLGRNDCL